MLSLLFLFWKTNCQQHLLFENMPLSSYLENSFWKKKMPWTFKQIPIYSYKWIFLHIYTLICLHIFVFNARSISTKHLKDSKYIMIPVWSLFTKEFETSRVFPCRTKKLRVFAFGEARKFTIVASIATSRAFPEELGKTNTAWYNRNLSAFFGRARLFFPLVEKTWEFTIVYTVIANS